MKLLMMVPGGVQADGRTRVIPALLALVERLARQHELTVIALRQYAEERRYPLLGAEVLNLGYGRIPFLNPSLQWHRLRRFLGEGARTFDLVHGFWLERSGHFAVKTAGRLRVPVVISLGGGEMVHLPEIRYGGYGDPLARSRIRKTLRAADAVTAGSLYALEPVRRLRPDAESLPLFPETRGFQELAPRMTGPPWRLVQVATINPVKDPETLLRAMASIIEVLPDTRLDWVGEDLLGGRVERRAAAMGLGGKIRFLGFQPYDAMPEIYGQAHLYIQSSLHESQGVAVCEAAASGLAVVGTAVGLARELAPERAVVVPPGNAHALARAVIDLLHDPQRYGSLSRGARAWAAEHDADWTAERFEALYQRLLALGQSA